MTEFFELKHGSKAYECADKVYSSHAKWSEPEVFDDLEKAIGIPITNNLQCCARVLRLNEMPAGSREQFKSKLIGDKYEAKVASDINKRYLEVVKKHNLVSYGMTEFALDSGLWGYIHVLHPIKTKDSLRYFVETKETISKDDLEKLRAKDSLSEMPEYEYLFIKAEMLKEKTGAQ